MNETDLIHLRRCIDLAKVAVDNGDKPFGSILVSGDGIVLFEDRNRTSQGDDTLHPEFAICRWAAEHLSSEERREATVYTSGEHCAMCAAAHGLVGLGRIIYASSTEQLDAWMKELGAPSIGIRMLPITAIIANARVEGPVPEFAETIRTLHARAHRGSMP